MITSIVLGVVIVALLIIQHFERKDLYNRIMSKDLREYKAKDNAKVINGKSAHSQTLKKWREDD